MLIFGIFKYQPVVALTFLEDAGLEFSYPEVKF